MAAKALRADGRPSALQRRLGPIDAAAVVVSNVIGVGIFATPGIVGTIVPHPAAMLMVWVAGGALAMAGAFAYAELSAQMPHAGGEYVYLRRAFGPLVGFLTGWTSFVAGFSGAVAAGAVAAAAYFSRLWPAAGDTTPILQVPLGVLTLTLSPQTLVATALVATLALLHVAGVGPGRVVQNALAFTKVAALSVIVILGFALGHGSMSHLTATEGFSLGPWMFALIPVMFSYSGWNAATYVAEEIRDPERNVPIALALGTGVVIAIYLALNLLYLYALPVSELGGAAVGAKAVQQLLGPAATGIMSVLTIVIILGSLSAMTLAGPRIYYAMARDGLFFRSAAHVHPVRRTPSRAIMAQAVWSILLVLSGSFDQLLAYTGFSIVLFSGIAVSSLFVLRRDKELPRPFRAWGYPFAPAVFVGTSALIVVNALVQDPRTCGLGLAVIAAGIPVYLWLVRSPPGAPDGPA